MKTFKKKRNPVKPFIDEIDEPNPVQIVVDIVGSQRALANICGVRQQQIPKWIQKRRVPPRRTLLIVEAIKGKVPKHAQGKVSKHALCPDIYPRDIT